MGRLLGYGPRNVPWFTPYELMEFLRKKHSISTFVETGTSFGKTARWAASRFKKVYTIEGSEEIYNQFGKTPANLTRYLGDSAELLPTILSEIAGKVMFWLDAHVTTNHNHDGYGRDSRHPLLTEINAITATEIESFLLIDDASLIVYPYRPKECSQVWPSLPQITDALKDYSVAIYGDSIVALPPYAHETYFEWSSAIHGTQIDLL